MYKIFSCKNQILSVFYRKFYDNESHKSILLVHENMEIAESINSARFIVCLVPQKLEFVFYYCTLLAYTVNINLSYVIHVSIST